MEYRDCKSLLGAAAAVLLVACSPLRTEVEVEENATPVAESPSIEQPPQRIGTMRAPGDNELGPPIPDANSVELLPAQTREVVPATAAEGVAGELRITDVDGQVALVEVTLDDGSRAVAFEWIMLVSPAQRQQLDTEATALMAYLSNVQSYTLTNGVLLTFVVPPDLDANEAILQLVPVELRELIDRNHVYSGQADSGAVHASNPLPPSMAKACETPLTIGLIDSALDLQHPAFIHLNEKGKTRLQQRSFVEAKLLQPAAHGTAVASVLVGTNTDAGAGAVLHPLLPNATVYHAAVFHADEGDHQGATALRVLNALDWLVSENDVQVINVSLAGPPNRLLEQAIAAAQQQGKLIVAATGNDGPNGPLRYPAGYDGVIGVTAVARDKSVFPMANHGAQVDFAAPGVDMTAALDGGSFGPVSGTSIASPVVAALAACALAAEGTAEAAISTLNSHAEDLGEPGPDVIYGKGLLYP